MNKPRRHRNVAKLLARLHPKVMPLQPSPGSGSSLPVETALDIAGALGAVGQKGAGPHLAALVLCLRWWPGLFEGPARTVGHRVVHHKPNMHKKLSLRMDQFTSACCERIPIEAPGETEAFRTVAGLLEARMRRRVYLMLEHCDLQERLKHAAFLAATARVETLSTPELRKAADTAGAAHAAALKELVAVRRAADSDFLATWSRAVIQEYRRPNHCQTCTPWGRAGEIPRPHEDGGKITRINWITCPTCLGAAVLAWSAKRRAKALRIGEHPFRNLLAPIHDGALSLLRELEWRGARLLIRRLGD